MSPQYHYYAFLPANFRYDFQALKRLCEQTFSGPAHRRSVEVVMGEDLSDLLEPDETPVPPLTELYLDDWCLCIAFEEGKHVSSDAKEVMAHPLPEEAGKLLAATTSRLEIWAEDPDPEMDFFNDVMILLQALESEWKVFLYDCMSNEPV